MFSGSAEFEREMPDMTAEQIRAMDKMVFDEIAGPWYLEARLPRIDFAALRHMLQARLTRFDELPDILRFFHHMPESYPITLYTELGAPAQACSAILRHLADTLPASAWEPERIDEMLEAQILQSTRFSRQLILATVSIGLCGAAMPVGTIGEIAYLLGREETVRRLRVGISKLG